MTSPIPDSLLDEVQTLALACLGGEARPEEIARLDALLSDNEVARRIYANVIRDSYSLRRWAAAEELRDNGLLDADGLDMELSPPAAEDDGPIPIVSGISPFSAGMDAGTWRGAAGWFAQTGPLSYIAATLILGVMLLGAWAYTITHDYGSSFAQNSSHAKNSRRLTAAGEPAAPQPPDPIFVARVTGMKDCRWADPATETFAGAFVPLGRKYALASGLMEITYRSGAKVILEGPCRYEVESDRGGFLALGKLTAKVEKRSEVRDQRSEAGGLAASAASVMPQTSNLPSPNGRGVGGEGNGNQKQSALTLTLSQRERGPDPSPKSQALRPKTEISKSPNLQISKSLFAVRTPTALVTDLGTEFGVEVAANGETTSHVFQGTINVRVAQGPAASESRGLAASAASDADQITLTAGQSARVAKNAATGAARITTDQQAGAAPRFVRRIYEPPKYLDLLDIVAGGNGTGNRRERGIDPASGLEDAAFMLTQRKGDGQYHRVDRSRLIDGVFIPDGGRGAVQLDSAGHAFDFPTTMGGTVGGIWARAARVAASDLESDRWQWAYTIGGGEQFMPGRRGLLCMHANAGLTFDLAALRKQHEVARPARFRAVAGLADAARVLPDKNPDGMADFWVFVDGRPVFERKLVRPTDGVFEVKVELGPNDRFLTLAVTDGNGLATYDWAVFGDPVLEMSPMEREGM